MAGELIIPKAGRQMKRFPEIFSCASRSFSEAAGPHDIGKERKQAPAALAWLVGLHWGRGRGSRWPKVCWCCVPDRRAQDRPSSFS